MTPNITWPTDHSSHTHTDKDNDKDKDKDKDKNKDMDKGKDKDKDKDKVDEVDEFQPIKPYILWKLITPTITWPRVNQTRTDQDKPFQFLFPARGPF